MSWLEAHITTTALQCEQLSEQLSSLGALALTTQDAGNNPIYEPALGSIPTWPTTTLVALFDAAVVVQPIAAYLELQQDQGNIQHFFFNSFEDENWERRCLVDFKPLLFGSRLWICPTWQTPPDPHAINLFLDPGLAFGTGTHATTALCLEWLEANMAPHAQVIDYGCGSGILGIAALKLGANHVFAIDHDPLALEETRLNSQRNQILNSQLITLLPDEESTLTPADILIANILALPLMELAPYLSSLVKPGGKIVLSGILKDQAKAVIDCYQPWFSMEPIVFKEEWVRLSGIRSSQK